MKRFLALLLSILVIIGLFAGCGKKTEQKEITVYTGIEDDFLKDYISIFNQSHPDIKVNIVRDSTGVITAKLLAEKDNPQADVVWGVAASSLLVLDKEKGLAEYAPKGLEKVNKKFVDSKNAVPHWIGTNLWTTAFTVNTEEGKKKNLQTPESYEDLLKSEYKDQIVMPNPGSSGTGFLTVSAWIQMMGEEKAWKYMDELNKNIKSYVHSGSAPTKTTATGEQVVGVGMDYESLKRQKDNPQITTVFPKEGLGWEIEALGLIKKENIKPEAKEFIDWAVSEEAFNAYGKYFGLVTLDGYKSKLEGYPADMYEKLINNDLNWAAENRERIINEWNKRYGSKK